MCRGITKPVIMVLFWIWIGAAVPEFLDAQIWPRYGTDGPVWWGFPWILTIMAMLVLSMVSAIPAISKCMGD